MHGLQGEFEYGVGMLDVFGHSVVLLVLQEVELGSFGKDYFADVVVLQLEFGGGGEMQAEMYQNVLWLAPGRLHLVRLRHRAGLWWQV